MGFVAWLPDLVKKWLGKGATNLPRAEGGEVFTSLLKQAGMHLQSLLPSQAHTRGQAGTPPARRRCYIALTCSPVPTVLPEAS